MNKRIKNKWIKALRSGEYSQGQGQLVLPPDDTGVPDYEFCCLGVLTNLYYEEKGEEFLPEHWTDGYPPEEVAAWAGFREYTGFLDLSALERDLASLNDDKVWSFKRIATYIEKNA